MYRLKKVDIGTVALYSFIIILIVSLLFMLPFGAFIMAISKLMPATGQPEANLAPLFGGLFMVVMPIAYAVFGTIMNVLIALGYNLLSIKLGGIKFDIVRLGELQSVE